MKFIPRHLKTDKYIFHSSKSIVDFKSELQTLFDNKWYDFSINLTGGFTSESEFQITKKISLVSSKSGSSGSTKLKCKIYSDAEKTIVDITVKPNPQLYVWTIIPPLFALLLLYSIIFHPTNDLIEVIVGIFILFFILPIGARYYGQAAKNELKDTFVDVFKLTKV